MVYDDKKECVGSVLSDERELDTYSSNSVTKVEGIEETAIPLAEKASKIVGKDESDEKMKSPSLAEDNGGENELVEVPISDRTTTPSSPQNEEENSEGIEVVSNTSGIRIDAGQTQNLTRQHKLNLIFCLLAWACIASTNTMVVGTSSLVILTIGGDSEMTTLPLGAFFLGAFLVSCLMAPWIFQWGRRMGFSVGVCLGLCGTILGCISILADSVTTFLFANLFYGGSIGLGFGLRFAAVEVVPPFFAAKAVALVVSGGCVAAFLGPELAEITVDMFGDDKAYLGTLIVTGIFNALNLIFILLIKFPGGEGKGKDRKGRSVRQLRSILRARKFLVAALVSSISWAAMAMPMSLVRVTMAQLGFSSRQSLTTLEFHFLGMFMTGFVSGPFIARWGSRAATYVAVVLFSISEIILLLAKAEVDGGVAGWLFGLAIVGIAWNFGFTGATVWLTGVYKGGLLPYKDWVQASNDSIMFAFAGIWTFSTSYIGEAGGGGRKGWQTVVLTSVLLVWIMAVALYWNRREESKEENENNMIKASDHGSKCEIIDEEFAERPSKTVPSDIEIKPVDIEIQILD